MRAGPGPRGFAAGCGILPTMAARPRSVAAASLLVGALLACEAGETGPEYHREQLAALEDELAELLYEQAELKRQSAASAAPRRAAAR